MAWLKKDVIVGLALALSALMLHLVIIPAQVAPSPGGPIALSPRLFCHITAALLLILSLNLTVVGLKSNDTGDDSAAPATDPWRVYVRGFIAVAGSAGYIVLISYAGYFVSTAIAMSFFLFFFGAKNWKGIVAFQLVILPFIYALFVKALKVVLPDGFFF